MADLFNGEALHTHNIRYLVMQYLDIHKVCGLLTGGGFVHRRQH